MSSSSRKRQSPLDRILGRLDNLNAENLTVLVKRLAGERDLLETVFNTIQEGILIIDAAGIVEYSNRAANRLIGINEKESGKVTLWKLVPELARSLDIHLDVHGVNAKTMPAVTREIEIAYPEQRHLRLHLSRLADEDSDAPVRFVVILLDVTADKISTEDLIESERVNSVFALAGGVAHELGNPLNSLTIHMQLIRRQLEKLAASPATEKIGDSVRICSEEIGRLDGIVKNFLEAIRPRDPDLNDLDLLSVIADVFALLRSQLEDLGVRVSVEIGQDLPVVSGDRNQLKQVFFNLVKNAMEAMDAGGKLDISASADDEFVFVKITDTGCGIERDEMTKIFDPFFTTKTGGHGLGMMVVLRILRAHGGHLGIESLPGKGTTMTVQLPQKHRRFRMLPDSGNLA